MATAFSDNWMGVAARGGKCGIWQCTVFRNKSSKGTMLQDKGSASVTKTETWANTAHGMFVGYDSCGRVLLKGNQAHHNQGDGIFVGLPSSRKALLQGNAQKKNRGRPAP
eukprot:jgi/Tetstr1/445631/TSEL_003436.t1